MKIASLVCRLAVVALPLLVSPALAEDAADAVGRGNAAVVAAYRTGQYREGIELAHAVLTKAENELGPDHPSTLTSVNNLAFLYRVQRRYGEAEPLFKRALEARERVLGPDHLDTLDSVNELAVLHDSQGRYGEAEPLFKRALEARERVLGPKHSDTLDSVNNLAFLYRHQGRYDEAESLYKRALDVRERVLGPDEQDDPATLSGINNLAVLYKSQGHYGEAEPLFKRALEARERVLGPEHPDTLTSVNNLAQLFEDQGRYDEAAPLYKRAMEVRERILGPDNDDTLTSVNDLAGLYLSQGRYGEAEPLYKRALEASEQVLGADHPSTLTSVNNLGLLFQSQGRYGEAEPLYKRALEARERVLGPDHPATLTSINNLAGLYESQGRHSEAEPLYKRALKARERVLGPDHPSTIVTHGNLAVLLVRMKRDGEALRAFRTLDQRLSQWLDAQTRSTRAAAVRRQMMANRSSNQDATFSFVLSRPGVETATLAADLTLRWKKRLAQDDAVLNNLARESRDPIMADAIKALRDRRAALSNAAFDPTVPPAEKQRLREAQEAAEAELRAKSAPYARFQEVKSARADEVQTALPTGAALIEYRFFDPFDFATGKFGATRLLAVVITPEATPAVLDLGEANMLRILAGAVADKDHPLRKEVPFATLARLGHDRLIAPLLPHLKGARSLYIAPDGPLHTVPFEALTAPDGQSLIQRMPVHMLQTGRDLVARDRPATGKGLVAVGGVDFGPLPQAAMQTASNAAALQAGEATPDTRQAAVTATREQVGSFAPLPESEAEAETIAKAYATFRPDEPAPITLTKDRATEAALKALKTPPRVLHLATHGYYLKTGSIDGEPLLQSGIGLAGANRGLIRQGGGTGENGILHAVEVQTLNLFGTELVVLSACDTGKGVVDYSEGLEGLSRAFYVAGAKNVLAALWPVGDRNARIFMERFYSIWLSQKISDPATALRQTKLEYITSLDPAQRNPDLWAPFVLFEG